MREHPASGLMFLPGSLFVSKVCQPISLKFHYSSDEGIFRLPSLLKKGYLPTQMGPSPANQNKKSAAIPLASCVRGRGPAGAGRICVLQIPLFTRRGYSSITFFAEKKDIYPRRWGHRPQTKLKNLRPSCMHPVAEAAGPQGQAGSACFKFHYSQGEGI